MRWFMRWLKNFVITVDNFSDKVGSVVCVMIFPMMLILVFKVVMRYGFNAPTICAHETSQQLYSAHFILGGVYALRWGSHVNVEILYGYLPPRKQAFLDLFTWLLFYLFCGFMLWEGWGAAWLSIGRGEISSSFWGPPLWPLKLTIPIAAILVLLQGLAKTTNDIYTAVTGEKLVIETIEKGQV